MTDPDVRDEIMDATYEALCERGYTDLTAQNIADRTDKSKSLLFYHYDSKEDLVVDFVDYVLDRFEDRVTETADRPPVERLASFLEWFLYGPDDEERVSFHTAMLELRTRAPHDERVREQLRRSDDLLRGAIEGILRDGIESGDFRPHDSAEVATLLIAAIDGARIRQLTLDRDVYLVEVRTAVVERVVEGLLAEGVEFPTRPDAAADADDGSRGDADANGGAERESDANRGTESDATTDDPDDPAVGDTEDATADDADANDATTDDAAGDGEGGE